MSLDYAAPLAGESTCGYEITMGEKSARSFRRWTLRAPCRRQR